MNPFPYSNLPPGVTDRMIDDQCGPDECETCGGEGEVLVSGEKEDCEDCNGSGHAETPAERRARMEEEKADRDMDEAKDRKAMGE